MRIRLRSALIACISFSAACLFSLHALAGDPFEYWSPDRRASQQEWESRLLSIADTERLREWHDLTASYPHRAGTEGDRRCIETMATAFESMGLSVERHPFWAYLAEPVSASVEILGPEVVSLQVREPAVEGDEFSADPTLSVGWNAYAGSGEAEGEVVYANYARQEDFERLAEIGVDVAGKIVIARFGGNFRGFKAKFAEQAGAAALIIYTDPADSGFTRGLMYPEGGWANESKIQRGSLKTLPYPGDPHTPFVEATKDAPRLATEDLALPSIPVQPVGWKAASEILSRMEGAPVDDRGWQGGLPFTYRLDGGDALRVRVAVEQTRQIVRSENVLATLEGATHPDEFVVIGCHHDAWEFGAADPTCGLIAVLEAARCFAALAEEGFRPARSIVFAGWGAEEYGIIGSTEWVEANRNKLIDNAVAYFNLDGAATGPNFGSSASPSLKSIILSAAADTPAFADDAPDGASLLDEWRERTETPEDESPSFGNLGGGSDHIAFYCHTGVPSAGLGMRGAKGDAYHSNYDTLTWYRKTVGNDYRSALSLTHVSMLVLARLSNADVLPLDPTTYATDVLRHIDAALRDVDTDPLELALRQVSASADQLDAAAKRFRVRAIAAAEAGNASGESLVAMNSALLGAERNWLSNEGLAGLPWFRNVFAASDPNSGYAAYMLPALRLAVESGQTERIEAAILDISHRLDAIRTDLEGALDG